ncbi:hypothetical protein RF11_12435 [Thelohanellus kitauei]|uniref:Uncharacterized protein n=1 Tax=Thelohanellus kitauei TaxID=669202 RepID=A0A0C2MWR2_THEKT|nr:hypothetical protein RF11_12435 [Thelohanellus kitauei]
MQTNRMKLNNGIFILKMRMKKFDRIDLKMDPNIWKELQSFSFCLIDISSKTLVQPNFRKYSVTSNQFKAHFNEQYSKISAFKYDVNMLNTNDIFVGECR